MLEAVVTGAGEDEAGAAQLLDVAQSLEVRRVDDCDEQRVKLDAAVNGVIENLHRGTRQNAAETR